MLEVHERRAVGASDIAAVSGHCLRWRGRPHSHRPAGESFEPGRYRVQPIAEGVAKSFVIQHHYSGSYPAARYRVGMYERCGARAPHLVGVAVFSVPMAQAVIPKHLPGLAAYQGVELGRFVLLDEVPGNAESWFLARAMRLLRRELRELRGVVSFCDPIERTDAQGRLLKRSHTGVIYRAHNAHFAKTHCRAHAAAHARRGTRNAVRNPHARCAG